MPDTVVIAGAGQAAAQAIITLRHGGFTGDIVLAGEEPYLPYQRPPLSKKFLAGETGARTPVPAPGAFLHGQPRRRAARHAGRAHRPQRGNGPHRTASDVRYDRLILATGSHVRRVPIPGQDLPEVHYLRTIDDVRGIQDALSAGTSPGGHRRRLHRSRSRSGGGNGRPRRHRRGDRRPAHGAGRGAADLALLSARHTRTPA